METNIMCALFWTGVSGIVGSEYLVHLRIPVNNVTQFKEQVCTGIILNQLCLLSNARCTDHDDSEESMIVISYATSNVSSKELVRWTKHEDYKKYPELYDLALVELLTGYISFTLYIQPTIVVLGGIYFGMKRSKYIQCSIIGWTDKEVLSSIEVEAVKDVDCQTMHPDRKFVICVKIVYAPSMFNLQLGSPLICDYISNWVVLGISSTFTRNTEFGTIYAFRRLDYVSRWLRFWSNGMLFIDEKSNKSLLLDAMPSQNDKKVIPHMLILSSLCMYYGITYI